MADQYKIQIQAPKRGFNLITREIKSAIGQLPDAGLLHLFIKHTSAGLAITENYDPDVRIDLENIFNELVPENQSYYQHVLEGPDDMPSHAKSIITGPELTIPITDGQLNLGTWQGIYLCEFRNIPEYRTIIATIL